MSLRQAALHSGVLLSLGSWICGAAQAADVPLDLRSMAEQRAPTAEGNTLSVWSDISYLRTEDRRPLAHANGRIWQSTTGFDFAFARTFTIGAGVSVARGRTTEFVIPGRTETDGVTGFGRATVYFLNNFNAGVIGGYGLSETDGFRDLPGVRETYMRESRLAFAGGHVGAYFEDQGFYVSPSARLLLSRTNHHAFVSSVGSVTPALRDDFTRASFGGEVGYRLRVGGVTVAPSIRAFGTYDIELPTGFTDRTAVELASTLNVSTGPLTAGFELLATLGRDEFKSHGARGYASYRF